MTRKSTAVVVVASVVVLFMAAWGNLGNTVAGQDFLPVITGSFTGRVETINFATDRIGAGLCAVDVQVASNGTSVLGPITLSNNTSVAEIVLQGAVTNKILSYADSGCSRCVRATSSYALRIYGRDDTTNTFYTIYLKK